MPTEVRVEGRELRRLEGWEVETTGDGGDVDGADWTFRTAFAADPPESGEEVVLRLGGIATVADVLLNGEPVLESRSMFLAHEVDVGSLLRGENELEIRCRALAPLLAERRRPRARWRTRLVADANLRFFRTTLLGRAPGFAPGPPPVGPWRPVELERRRGLALDELTLRPRLEGPDGVLAVRLRLRALAGDAPPSVEVEAGEAAAASLPVGADGVAEGTLRLPGVARWWPHTHGEPALHAVRVHAGGAAIAAARVGFRALDAPADVEAEGLALRIDGVPVFARGAVWTPVRDGELRRAVEQACEAGMNMLRVPGTGVYESDEFHDLCDELGVLVWQDFMFANMDYPLADDEFRALVEREARQLLARVAGRPSTAVLCGGSEVEQQVAMLGLDPALARGELFRELLPRLVRESGADAVYVPSAPCGGDLPFRPDRGVANYYGVGGYRRPLADARLAGVRFAAECLAFANVPDDVEDVLPVGAPRWKAGVPRDVGSPWDFDDVRDHYLGLLFGVDPAELRAVDEERYLELSRAVSGEVMAEVFGEWRRRGSPCAGGLVLWLRDLLPGAGWGVVDHRGEPKAAWHHLRRALAPVAVWTTDEGLGGVDVHVANDRPEPLAARLRVSLYRDLEQRVEEAAEDVELGPHSVVERNVEAMLGRFVDASYAYRFGPPGHDALVASLERADGELVSQAVRFPAARPLVRERPERLGLEASLEGSRLRVRTQRLAYGVRVRVPAFDASDDAFCVEPGRERVVRLRSRQSGESPAGGSLTALNLAGALRVG